MSGGIDLLQPQDLQRLQRARDPHGLGKVPARVALDRDLHAVSHGPPDVLDVRDALSEVLRRQDVGHGTDCLGPGPLPIGPPREAPNWSNGQIFIAVMPSRSRSCASSPARPSLHAWKSW